MEVYKILHKPTGLFFTPSKGHGNLSTSGKIYSRKPNLSSIGGLIRLVIHISSNQRISEKNKLLIDYFKINKSERNDYWVDSHFNVPESDWEIIKF